MSDVFSDRCVTASTISRRRFLGSAAALSAAAALPTLTTGCSQTATPAKGLGYLRHSDLALLRTITPSIVGVLPIQLDEQTWHRYSQQLDRSLAAFGPQVAAEYLELFDLLEWLPTRGLLAGQWQNWHQADAADVEEFLKSWRNSAIAVLNKGYRALTAWQQSSWYALADHSDNTGYPGAPSAVRKALGIS